MHSILVFSSLSLSIACRIVSAPDLDSMVLYGLRGTRTPDQWDGWDLNPDRLVYETRALTDCATVPFMIQFRYTDRRYIMKCQVCKVALTGKQSKFCSPLCKSRWWNTRAHNPDHAASQNARGIERKLDLIRLKGGCCERCGYNKNSAALAFHHVAEKNFPLDMRHLGNIAWARILAEAEVCELLCANCHAEVHHPGHALTD